MAEDFLATLRDAIAHLATHDPACKRFGARHHRYRVGPPIAPARLDELERDLEIRLPDEYREHVLAISDGGAGPYHGLMPLDHPIQLAAARGTFGPGAPYQGVVGLTHLGCGYVAFLVVRGEHRGQVWLDARGSGDGVFRIDDDFRAFVLEWIDTLARNRLPRGFVTPGRCALPAALTSYLHAVEDREGVARGALPPAKVREALDAIGPGGIATADTGDTPFFASGDAIDLCPTCEQTVENLLPQGLRRDQLVPGLAPLPMR
jgi:hypothetical protein